MALPPFGKRMFPPFPFQTEFGSFLSNDDAESIRESKWNCLAFFVGYFAVMQKRGEFVFISGKCKGRAPPLCTATGR
jgi:hypothetical protein